MEPFSESSNSTNLESISGSPLIREKSINYDKSYFINRFAGIIKTTIIENKKLIKEHKIEKIYLGRYFIAKSKPKIKIEDFLERIIEYLEPEKATLITSMVLLDRLTQGDVTLTKFNVHKLILVAIVISQKILEDNIYKNSYYAKVGGLSLQEFNKLEDEFVKELNFNFYIRDEEYKNYYKSFFLD